MPETKREPPPSTEPGDCPPLASGFRETIVVADRFVVERLAGRGGMGLVYRAVDRVSGEPVAIKVIADDEGDAPRFAREAQLLAELDHPAIVRYVAHGATAEGKPYLVMEWLRGDELGPR